MSQLKIIILLIHRVLAVLSAKGLKEFRISFSNCRGDEQRDDARVQPWIRSAEPPREHRYENGKKKIMSL